MTEGVLLILQNIQADGVEFAERMIEMQDQSLLIGGGAAQPAVLTKGTNGQVLKIVSNQIAWADEEAIENLTGTTNGSWTIDSDGANPIKLNNSVGVLELKNSDGSAFIDVEAKDGAFDYVTLNHDPTAADHATRKGWVESHVSTKISSAMGDLNGAMIMKGNINAQGDVPTTYEVGWTYRVNTDGVYFGKSCEVGDLLTAIVARTGSGNANTDWTVGQTNVVDAVTFDGAGSITHGDVAIYSGTSGKSLTASGISYSDLLVEQDLGIHGMVIGDDSGAKDTVNLDANSFVGRAASGGIQSLSANESRTILNVEDGANNYTHPSHTARNISATALQVISSFTSDTKGHVTAIALKTLSPTNLPIWATTLPATHDATGSKGQMFIQDDYLYVCVATNTWRRVMLAKTWAS